MNKRAHGRALGAFLVTLAIISLAVGSVGAKSTVLAPQAVSTAPGSQVILVHDDRYIPHHVPPPPQIASGLRIQAATFSINWNPTGCSGTISPWPNDAKAAFQYAVGIWSSLLNSSETIVVNACWRSDLPSGVLGMAGTTTVHRGFANAPIASTWYPAALANALENSDLNDSDGSDSDGDGQDDDAEIMSNFSSTFNWYYGTDGNTPPSEVDFASVVLHELGHGLGFLGFGDVSAGSGSIGYVGYPATYDRFTEDGNGTPLLDYTNPSTSLGDALTGQVGGVYFDGSNARAANGGSQVKLYAPNPWEDGSSYSHLDEIFNNTPNALMTYSLGNGESEHSPGPVTLGMFEDMGWTVAGTAPAPTVTSITPATGVNTGTVHVADLAGSNFMTPTVKLTKSGEADIPGVNVTLVSPSSITCDFDLTGATVGTWHVVVTNYDNQSGTLVDGFAVTAPPAPDVTLDKEAIGGSFESGDPITFALSIANSGDKTASGVVVTDVVPAEVRSPTYTSTLNITPTGVVSFVWDVEPLAIGESGLITVYGWVSPSLPSGFSFVNTATVSDPEDVTPDNNTSSVTIGARPVYLPLVVRCHPLVPYLHPIENPDGDGVYTVSWLWPSSGSLPSSYQLQGDDDPQFGSPDTFSGSTTTFEAYSPMPGTYYWRVRASLSGTGWTEWSNVQSVTVGDFAHVWIDNDTGGDLTVEVVGVEKEDFSPGLYYWRSVSAGQYTYEVEAWCGKGTWSEYFPPGEVVLQFWCGYNATSESATLFAGRDVARPRGVMELGPVR